MDIASAQIFLSLVAFFACFWALKTILSRRFEVDVGIILFSVPLSALFVMDCLIISSDSTFWPILVTDTFGYMSLFVAWQLYHIALLKIAKRTHSHDEDTDPTNSGMLELDAAQLLQQKRKAVRRNSLRASTDDLESNLLPKPTHADRAAQRIQDEIHREETEEETIEHNHALQLMDKISAGASFLHLILILEVILINVAELHANHSTLAQVRFMCEEVLLFEMLHIIHHARETHEHSCLQAPAAVQKPRTPYERWSDKQLAILLVSFSTLYVTQVVTIIFRAFKYSPFMSFAFDFAPAEVDDKESLGVKIEYAQASVNLVMFMVAAYFFGGIEVQGAYAWVNPLLVPFLALLALGSIDAFSIGSNSLPQVSSLQVCSVYYW
jgi:hypothetical protein